jgi:hypothetical protein
MVDAGKKEVLRLMQERHAARGGGARGRAAPNKPC